MNAAQLLKQIQINRDLITRKNDHAYEHLQILKSDYAHLTNEQVSLSLELNNSLAEVYFHSNYSGAVENSLRALETFKGAPYTELIALHKKTIGHCYANMGEFQLAEKFLLEALNTFSTDRPGDVNTRADILHSLAMNQEIWEEGNAKSIQYLTEAIEMLSGEGNDIRRASCMMGMGNIYNNAEKVDEALKYYRMAAETFEHHFVLANMAGAYSNIGNCYIKLKDFDQAERYLEKSLELRLKFAAPDDLSISYFNLAIVYKERKDFDKAEEFLVKSKQILEQVGNKPYITLVNEMMDDLARMRKGVEV